MFKHKIFTGIQFVLIAVLGVKLVRALVSGRLSSSVEGVFAAYDMSWFANPPVFKSVIAVCLGLMILAGVYTARSLLKKN